MSDSKVYPVERLPLYGVWMSKNPETLDYSASRMVALDAMEALKLDPNDFKTRDRLILAIHDRINGMLDYASGLPKCKRVVKR